jgi:hypothetical protein
MSDKPEVRVLACMNCKTVEELPDFKGPPELDEVLAAAAYKHRSAGIPHTGQLFRVPEVDWGLREKRDEIRKQIAARMEPGAETGLGSEAYAMVDNFKSDAMDCFERHMRNANCNDYKSDAKRLVPNTAAERKELGLAPARHYDREGGQITKYLCEYCPVHSMVQQAQRKKAGLYDK